MFDSSSESHREGDALVYEPPRMALWEHAKLLDTKAAEFRKIGADDLAEELEIRAKQVRADRSGPVVGSASGVQLSDVVSTGGAWRGEWQDRSAVRSGQGPARPGTRGIAL